MDGRERPDTGDQFDAEVSDVRPRADVAPRPPARSPLAPRLTPRQRLIRVAISLSTGVLALAVVLSSVAAVRDGVAGLASRLLPPPIPTLASGIDVFYLLPNPPGVDVALDGHALAHLPFPGDPHPLRLAPGHHVFAWHSRIFPFFPRECSVSVLPAPTDTCPFLDLQQLPAQVRSTPGRVIAMHVGLDTLLGYARYQLAGAVQQALDARSSSALVQPGERYYSAAPAASVATQPLRATLGFQFNSMRGYPDPCLSGQRAVPCRFPGQNCFLLCTLSQPPSAVARAPDDWIAAALVSSVWSYTTLDGQVVAHHVTDGADGETAMLRITWDGATWHVTPLLGYTPGLPADDDLVCDPARYWLQSNGRWAFMLADGHPGTAQFVSDTTPTDGCLVVLDPHPGSDVPAVFLERFGVLRAVNAAANGPGANLPLADGAEQSLAHHLAAQAQLTF